MSHVRELRLQHACRLLQDTELTVGQVAHASGFVSQFHFSRAFRARHGMPPTTFRATIGR